MTRTAPADQSLDKLEKKETLPLTGDVEGANKREDPLALLEKIRTTDDAHPIRWPVYKKWFVVCVYCLLQIFVTLTSTTYVSVEFLIMEKWTTQAQVATLGQSMFIVGTAVGPAFLGEMNQGDGDPRVIESDLLMYR